MLFRKKQPKDCQYCIFSTSLQEDLTLCSKHGIRLQNKPCRKFRYDPCKRIPPKSLSVDIDRYSQKDFEL